MLPTGISQLPSSLHDECPQALAFISDDQAAKLDGVSVLPHDVLVNITGDSVARVCQAPNYLGPARVNQHVAIVRPDERYLNARFLRYYLVNSSFQEHMLALASVGATRPALTKGMIEGFEIDAPSIEEQGEIAGILGSLDDKIELNRRMAATLEEMARSLYRSWFVNFDPVHAKAAGHPPAHMDPATAALFPDRFGDDGLPEGWARVATGELVTFTKGRSYKSSELKDSDTALISLKSFQRGGGYRYDGLKAFTGAFKPEQVVSSGELVISLTDVTQAAELIGRATYARKSREFSVLVASLDVGILRPFDDTITPIEFLHQTFNCNEFLEHALAHTTGTTVLHLAKEAILNFQMILPTAAIAEAFQELCSPIRSRIFRLEIENQTLATLRDSLLPRLMSGELRGGASRELVEDVA